MSFHAGELNPASFADKEFSRVDIEDMFAEVSVLLESLIMPYAQYKSMFWQECMRITYVYVDRQGDLFFLVLSLSSVQFPKGLLYD